MEVSFILLRYVGYNEAMSTNKTVANSLSVEDFIASLSSEEQKNDSLQLISLFRKVTGDEPVMWGAAIIGFGSAHITYASGRELDWMNVGFSPRVGKISLYVTFDAKTLTSKFPNLGTYKIAKGCIYLKRLSDINIKELEELIRYAVRQGFEQPQRIDGKEQIIDIK